MNQYVPQNTRTHKEVDDSRVISYFKVFLWFGLGLLITGGLALGIPYLLPLMFNSAEALATAYIIMIIVSAILMIPSYIILIVQAFRKNTAVMATSYVVYAIAEGILLSSLLMMLAPANVSEMGGYYTTIGLAFLATAGCFIVMGIFAAIFKKTMPILIPLVFVLLIGSFIISIVNIFLGSAMISWVISFVMFGAILLITAIDIWRLRRLVESGAVQNCTNIALWCAFTLYTDFIAIFVRILIYMFASRRN